MMDENLKKMIGEELRNMEKEIIIFFCCSFVCGFNSISIKKM